MQLAKGKGALFFCFRRDGNQCQCLWLFLQPAVDSVVAQIGSAFTKPTGKRRIAVVERLRKGRLPVNTPGLLGPELLRFVNRTLIKFAKRHNALLLNLRLTAVYLNDVQVEILIDRHLFQASSVERNLQNALLLASRELAREIDFEFIDQFRNTILTAASMTNGVLHTTSSNRVPSVNSRVMALAMARFSGSW